MEKTILAPTLWRTCRVLANPRRLALMRLLLNRKEASVSELAEEAGMPVVSCSAMLRQIQARGLISARRQGSAVCYRLEANPDVAHAPALLKALREVLVDPEQDAAHVWAVTAFTHTRRLTLARALANGRHSLAALRKSCRMSDRAFARHMGKLLRRGFALEVSEGVFSAAPQSGALRVALWREAVGLGG